MLVKRDMHLIIPTHNRQGRQFTLREIPEKWLKKVILVCTHGEARAHAIIYKEVNVWEAPKEVKTIAQKRKWILEECHRRDMIKIMMLDDDLRFSRRKFTELPNDKFTFQLLKAKPKDVDWAFRLVAKKLDEFAHVGIGPRQGNNGIKIHRRWNPNYRMIYCLGYRVDTVVRKCKLGRIEHREDMDITLQLLTKGYPNRVMVEVTADQQYNGVGGTRGERSYEKSNADAELLASWFPKFIKVVERDYKQSVPRKEVIVAWKKAYEFGAERRERASRDGKNR
jgi:hypothetical protein